MTPSFEVGQVWLDQYGDRWEIIGEDPDYSGVPFVRPGHPVLAMHAVSADCELFDWFTGEVVGLATVLRLVKLHTPFP